MLGELMWVVKEFTEVLTRVEKKVFIHFPREERGQTHRVVLALKGVGVSLLLCFKGQGAGKSGGGSHLFWSTVVFGLAVLLQDVGFLRICDLLFSVIF